MSQLIKNNNEKNDCITKELSKTKIINDCKMSNHTDININKFKQKYTNNKLISSYEEDYTRNSNDIMRLWQRN
jgi:hypothetical protein